MTIQMKQDVIAEKDLVILGEANLPVAEADSLSIENGLTVNSVTNFLNETVTGTHTITGGTSTNRVGIGVDPDVANGALFNFANVVEEKMKYWIDGPGRNYYGHAVESSRLVHQVPTGMMHRFVDGGNSVAHTIQEVSWVNASINIGGGWANYGGGWGAAKYTKDHHGFVWVRGLTINSAKTNDTIFTLPAGFRPAKNHLFPADAHTGAVWQLGRVDVYPDGQVYWVGGGTAGYFSLSNIVFKAEQ